MKASTGAARSRSLEQLLRASDAELVWALAQNDPRAPHAIWRRFKPVVSGMARRRLGSGGDAEDAVQDIFLQVFRGARGLREPLALRAFVLTVTTRTLAREVRRRRGSLSDVAPSERLEQLRNVGADPASKHALIVLKRLLGRLRARERRAFVLRFVEGCDATEVARVLGVSKPTARRSLLRARDRIELWAGRDPFLSDYIVRAWGEVT